MAGISIWTVSVAAMRLERYWCVNHCANSECMHLGAPASAASSGLDPKPRDRLPHGIPRGRRGAPDSRLPCRHPASSPRPRPSGACPGVANQRSGSPAISAPSGARRFHRGRTASCRRSVRAVRPDGTYVRRWVPRSPSSGPLLATPSTWEAPEDVRETSDAARTATIRSPWSTCGNPAPRRSRGFATRPG